MWRQVHIMLHDNNHTVEMWQDCPLNNLDAFSVNIESR